MFKKNMHPSLTVTIYIVNTFLYHVTCYSYRPGNEPFQIIGIFSNCYTNKTSQQYKEDEFYQKADVCKKSIEWVIQNKEYVANTTELYYRTFRNDYLQKKRKWSVDDIKYLSFDVCTEGEAVALAVDVLLNPKYHVSNKYQSKPSWMGFTIINYNRTTRILSVMLYTNNLITDIILGLLRLATFPVYHLNSRWKLPIKYEKIERKRKKTFTSNTYYHKYFRGIQWLLKRKRVMEFNVVLLGKKNKYYEYFLQRLNTSKMYCYSVEEIYTLTNNSLHEFLERFKRLPKFFKYTFLFGHGFDQINLYNKAIRMGILNKTWYMHNVEVELTNIESIPEGTEIVILSRAQNQDLQFFDKLKRSEIIHDYVMKNLERKLMIPGPELLETSDLCHRKMKRMYMAYFRSVDDWTIKDKQFWPFLGLYLKRFQLYNAPVHGGKALLYITKDNKTGRLSINLTFKYKFIKDNLICQKPLCQSGRQTTYGREVNPTIKVFINYTIRWACEKCPENSYKDFTGEGQCIQCPEMNRASKNRDYCYDPYHITYNNVQRLSVRLCIAASVLGFLLSTIIISTFFWNKTTPLVRASVFEISIIHLVLLCLSFCSYPLLFFSKPTVIICSMRPLIISIINLLCVAVMLIKTNKILVAFQSKVRVRKTKKTRLTMLHVVLTFVFISIGGFIGFISLMKIQPSNIRETINHITMTRDLSCSTGMNVNFQIVYLLILHILPAVQAFRGRHLPGPFNEALAIVYITFITIVAYCTMLPIYYSQQVESDKATVQCCVIIIANLVQITALYIKKTSIILFRRHKNSKEYVLKRTQNTILKNNSINTNNYDNRYGNNNKL